MDFNVDIDKFSPLGKAVESGPFLKSTTTKSEMQTYLILEDPFFKIKEDIHRTRHS